MTIFYYYWWIALLTWVHLWRFFCNADELPTCQAKDFHYEFTDCDEQGGRWRVSVPSPGRCTGGAPNAPVRVTDCKMNCSAGSFYNVSELSCQKCLAGTYSLGGRVIFDSWNEIPAGFNVDVENFQSSIRALYFKEPKINSPFNCTKFGWQPLGDAIASQVSPCSGMLVYTVTLVKPGKLTYTYQYLDNNIVFHFQAQDGHCQLIDLVEQVRWPPLTEEGKWATLTVPLNAGLNILKWRTIGVNPGNHRHSIAVTIKSVEITGLDYNSTCVPCESGTYSTEGATECTKCGPNTYSGTRATKCINCKPDQYSESGSSKCITKSPCKESDYYEVHTPCDSLKQTQINYRWMEPKICNEDAPGAKKLPPPSKKMKCPPCNAGMHYINATGCVFCPPNYYSDENRECHLCPASAAPNYGYQYSWWNELPPNIEGSCALMSGRNCFDDEGWLLSGDHIKSRIVRSRDAYTILTLKVPGFRTKDSYANDHPGIVGNISFTFQLSCTSGCEFLFMQQTEARGGTAVVQSWNGTKGTGKQHFVHNVRQNDTYTFSWLFIKEGNASDIPLHLVEDHVKIFTINVTNTIDGGASECISCRHGDEKDSCVPCPPGHYLDANSTQCHRCPPDTFVTEPFPYGLESCQPCGPGLHSNNGYSCYSDCIINANNGRQYDLKNLAGFHLVQGCHLFSSSGTEYFNAFNISFCGDESHGDAQCINNVTAREFNNEPQILPAKVCRSTIIVVKGSGITGTLSSQSISIGDQLLGVTTKPSLSNVLRVNENINTSNLDLHFFYSSPVTTELCPNGRWTTVTLRCDLSATGHGLITLPPSCPTGTCDGCSFHFLWTSRWACPMCTEEDYEVVAGECSNGVQTVHYITPEHCLTPEGVKQLENKKRTCSSIPEEVQIIIGVAALLGVLLLVLVIYFWKKNRKLEYKYMKLVQSASTKDGELPPAESCALHDDEEDHFDSVEFKESKSKLLINKLRSMASAKDGKSQPFEFLHLTEKDDLT